jgi:hypothetical protein
MTLNELIAALLQIRDQHELIVGTYTVVVNCPRPNIDCWLAAENIKLSPPEKPSEGSPIIVIQGGIGA